MSNGDPSRGQMKWWQWVLMYPTLIIAVTGAIPTAHRLYQSWQIKVSLSEVDYAVSQNDFWRKNIDCLSGKTFEQVTTSSNVKISAVFCPSGDILVRLKPPDPEAREIVKWIGFKDFMGKSSEAWLFGSAAIASQRSPKIVVAQADRIVICQRWLADGLLLMRVRYSNGQCVDETINTYTGVVIDSVPAPCDPKC